VFPADASLSESLRESLARVMENRSTPSVVGILERALSSTSCTVILEKDGLHVVPCDEALEFWRTWWASEDD